MDYQVSPKVASTLEALLALPAVKAAVSFIEANQEETIQNQIALTKIPAPTFHEAEKAKAYAQLLTDLGLSNVHLDGAGNVVGVYPGSGKGPKILMEAHLDTVFPMDTVIEPRRENGYIHAPGIVDDTRGLVAILSVIRALKDQSIKTEGDIVFVGTVQEEGMGGLGGMKAFLGENDDIAASISLDGPGAEGITFEATGFKTYEATFHGIGGHAYGAFGKVANPLHAAARAVAKIADFQVPEDPRTTFCVSNFHAGSDASIHAIVPSATIKFNFRSNSPEELVKLDERILATLKEAAREESERWGKDEITVDWKIYCDIPAGKPDPHLPIVEASFAVAKALGLDPYLNHGGSTNCNIAVGKGIPAVCLGDGRFESGAHTLQEVFCEKDAFQGPQQALLVALLCAGVVGGPASIL